MIRRISFLAFLVCCFWACESNGNGCEEGYMIQYGAEGSTFCVEEFVEDVAKDSQPGDTYYHKKHGVITYVDGIWTDRFDQQIIL